jgi:hypothetical protein
MLLNMLEERSSKQLLAVKDRETNDLVPGLLCHRALETVLLLLLLYNKAADNRIPINRQRFLRREFL